MHMRRKKWAKPELSVCPYFTDTPEQYRGNWRMRFAKQQPLYVELGCGKGVSTAKMTADMRDRNFIAFDVVCDVLGDARRNIEKAFGDDPVDNVMLAKADICTIGNILSQDDRVERIYINFCNPWTKHVKDQKKRLTHPRQLLQYREFLTENGEIWFKTDDDKLFDDSLICFDVSGFDTVYMTRDLHASGFTPNYVSEHEMMFSEQGIPIKFGIFRKTDRPVTIEPMRWRVPDSE